MTSVASPRPTRTIRAVLVASIVGLAACTSTSTPGSAPPSTAASVEAVASLPAESAAASASPEASTSVSGGPTAVPTAIDPCQLISAQEAGTLAGATFGAGKETTTQGNARICTYTAGATNAFSVEVAIAPDVATAQADEKAVQDDLTAQAAKLANQGVTVTPLPGFAQGADAILAEATVSLGGNTVGVRAMLVLRGTTFFSFSDVDLKGSPPSADAMKTEATTVLGRLP
jgi:hypothetical protein